jgi:hypothetical protein
MTTMMTRMMMTMMRMMTRSRVEGSGSAAVTRPATTLVIPVVMLMILIAWAGRITARMMMMMTMMTMTTMTG